MKKIAVLLSLLLLITCFSDFSYAAGETEDYFTGKINNRYAIQMNLYLEAGNKISGMYFYDSANVPIRLSGTLQNKMMTLTEMDARDKKVAVFQGKLENNVYSGNWESVINHKKFPFRLVKVKLASGNWVGEWERLGGYYSPAGIQIKKATASTLNFELSSSSGGNVGEISGVAKIQGAKAYYKDPESGAEVILANYGKVIKVETNQQAYQFAGMGVVFNGLYKKSPFKGNTPTLYDVGVFDSREQDKLFRKVVKDDYSVFLNNMQLSSYDGDDRDIDHLNAQVVSGCVRGLADSMAAIIMHTKDNRFWAAATVDDAICYYTNSDMKEMPKTIQAWCKRYGKKVKYMR